MNEIDHIAVGISKNENDVFSNVTLTINTIAFVLNTEGARVVAKQLDLWADYAEREGG
jgi:hypothetical protein